MRTSVALGGAATFRLKHALMIYMSTDHDQGAYVTVHDRKDGPRGAARLGPGRPADHAFLRALSEALQTAVPPEILPACVIARTPDVIAWWSPARPRPMHFRERTDLGRISGRILPQPALVWKLSGRQLYVRALEASERPGPKTPLYIAPYWNTDRDGRVCLGSMKRPDRTSVDRLGEWEDGFYGSLFTGQNQGGRYTRHERGIVGLWRAVRRNRRKTFPVETLEPAGQSALEFVGGGHA